MTPPPPANRPAPPPSHYSAAARARRGLRVVRNARLLPAAAPIADSPAASSHIAAVAPGDRHFWIAHRHYLARGLSARARLDAALGHYAAEDARVAGAVPRRLWSRQVDGVDYAIDLTQGQDVLYEGGLSVVLSVDGGRVAVVSGSFVPRHVVGLAGEGLIPFVTRLHRAHDHGYQAAFHKAFHRVTATQMGLAAWGAMAQARGHAEMFGIAGRAHPSWIAAHAAPFDASYDQVWLAHGGVAVGRLGYRVPLPFAATPLDAMPAAKRKRAMVRRAHLAEVAAAARAAG